jgi:hypothetical protein
MNANGGNKSPPKTVKQKEGNLPWASPSKSMQIQIQNLHETCPRPKAVAKRSFKT